MAYNVINSIKSLSNAVLSLGNNVQAIGGPEGEQIAAENHGKWYHRARAQQLFVGSTLIAGTTIPVNAASLVSTFTLLNPVGSGVTVELARYMLGLAGTTTAVIGNIGLAYQTNGAALASLTALTPVGMPLNGGIPSRCNLYSAATYTGTPTFLMSMGISFGTTGANPGPSPTNYFDFDGTVVISPGTSLTVVGNVAQTQPMSQAFVWAELPF